MIKEKPILGQKEGCGEHAGAGEAWSETCLALGRGLSSCD